ncbi:MAG: Uma2 family endonuclease [Moraxellaceae bacterium]|nr:Uma2 family endonuclease [Moraxellaceae bacterium]MCC6373471.1 Uma2 family endonuclease [Moraxellaceae bacterium]
MATARQVTFISEEDYLEGEKIAELKHEYVDGHIYAMAGAHSNHNSLALNISSEFKNHLKGKPCRAYMSDMKVRIANGSKYYYPDVLVNCPPVNGYFTETPTIIVEVLSNSTRRIDETEKRIAYMQIETLEEYVLIAQDFVQIEVIRKSDDWKAVKYFLGDEVTFTSIGLTLSVEAIYDGVDNDDMVAWLKQK